MIFWSVVQLDLLGDLKVKTMQSFIILTIYGTDIYLTLQHDEIHLF